jgi:type IV pilus assembly protein PilA
MKNLQKGFTLIELMIVVAIIAILAAIAIPAYQNYLIRAQVSEGAVLADGLKTPLAEYYSNHGGFPQSASNASIGLPANATSVSGKYVSQVQFTANGVIEATFGTSAVNSAISGSMFTLSPIVSGGSIAWSCTSTIGNPVPQKYMPASCRK